MYSCQSASFNYLGCYLICFLYRIYKVIQPEQLLFLWLTPYNQQAQTVKIDDQIYQGGNVWAGSKWSIK